MTEQGLKYFPDISQAIAINKVDLLLYTMSWFSEQIGLYFKHKFYPGTRGAWRLQWDIMKKRPWRVPGFTHPIYLDANNQADVQTFNDVVLKQSYSNIIHPKNDVKRIIDLGANIGLSVIVFLHEFPHAEIVALEPDAGNFNWLEKNMNRIRKWVEKLH
jgi:hypothetical protein